MKTKYSRCNGKNIFDASEMSDTGIGDSFCIDCGIYFYKNLSSQNKKENQTRENH